MTKTNSTADFFGNYFRFKINNGKFVMLLSALFGFFSFFQYSVLTLFGAIFTNNNSKMERSALIDMSEIGVVAAFFGIFVLVVISAVSCFDFHIHRHRTDMLGSLPITHRQRFWGDFISGYLIGAAPFAVLSALSIAIVAIAESVVGKGFYFTSYYACFVLTIIFVITFVYAAVVLGCSLGGKTISALACAGIIVLASISVVPGIGGYFAENITGMNCEDINRQLVNITPTIMLFEEDFSVFDFISNSPLYNMVPRGMWLPFSAETFEKIVQGSAIANMPNVILWIVETAALVAAAFYLTKHRKTERTGSAFGHKYGYYFVLAGAVLTISALILKNLNPYANSNVNFVILLTVFSILLFLVFEISMRRGWKNFGKGAAVLAGSVLFCIGIAVLINKTGSFGLRNKLPNEDEIEYVIANNYRFDSKEDIAEIRKNHLDFLNKYGNDIITAQETHVVETLDIQYKLKNGENFTRIYAVKWDITDKYNECKTAMLSVVTSINGFSAKLSEFFAENEPERCDIVLKNAFGGVNLKSEKTKELADIISEEYARGGEKGKRIGTITFYFKDGQQSNIPLDIYDTFEKTVAFLNSPENIYISESDAETVCYDIDGMMNNNRVNYRLVIRKKDLGNAKVKELISLISESRINTSGIVIFANDNFTEYNVTVENKAKFNKLALEILQDRILAD